MNLHFGGKRGRIATTNTSGKVAAHAFFISAYNNREAKMIDSYRPMSNHQGTKHGHSLQLVCQRSFPSLRWEVASAKLRDVWFVAMTDADEEGVDTLDAFMNNLAGPEDSSKIPNLPVAKGPEEAEIPVFNSNEKEMDLDAARDRIDDILAIVEEEKKDDQTHAPFEFSTQHTLETVPHGACGVC
jgi:hypothetical protein